MYFSNFDCFLFLPVSYLVIKEYNKRFKDEIIFLIRLTALSALPVFIRASITQRILFISVPALVIISSLFIKKIEKKWYIIIPILLAYVLSSFLMDSYILNAVNISAILG